MARTLKLVAYRFAKALGLFSAARLLTRRGLRILCYHGFTLADECDFRPGMFIRRETFERRMRYLSSNRYPVLTLQEAAAGLDAGRLPSNATVITIDDGFYGVGKVAAPILKAHNFPATLYVTSYYAIKQTPIFRLALQYMFWKTRASSLDPAGLGLPGPQAALSLSGDENHRVMWDIIRFGETELDESGRSTLARALGQRLGVDYDALDASRRVSLLSAEELRRLPASGVDLQLHTHRHHLPEDQSLVERELTENRAFLEPVAATSLTHFCYPSGVWSKRHWPWLAALDVATATTCDPGLNYPSTPRLGLRRFLDGEDISQIEFEADVSGFAELLRQLRDLFRGVTAGRWIEAPGGAATGAPARNS